MYDRVILWGVGGKQDMQYLNDKLQSMIDNYCSTCTHMSDGLIYLSNPPQNKCKLCKQFYRGDIS